MPSSSESDRAERPIKADAAAPRIPRLVWVLGFVSLLMDVSSEMIHAVLPLFMVQVLAADMVWVGLTEGAAEGIALAAKVFSGVWADCFGHKKFLVFLGYALGVASKPVFAAADAVSTVFFARFADRIGKGIRGAPRDALIAQAVPKEILGAAFGLRQSLDAAGAFVGPAAAAALLWLLTDDAFRTIFWLAFIPGVLCLVLIVLGVEDKDVQPTAARPKATPASVAALWRRIRRDPAASPFRALLGIALLLSTARFSSAFIALRAADIGFANAWVPLVMVVMNLVYSLGSYPFGRLADHLDPIKLLSVGLLFLTGAQLALAWWPSAAGLFAGIVLWGLHLAATQGVMAALAAKTAEPEWRATAFGLFNLASSFGMLASGIFAGALWDVFGASAAFSLGAAAAAACLAALAAFSKMPSGTLTL